MHAWEARGAARRSTSSGTAASVQPSAAAMAPRWRILGGDGPLWAASRLGPHMVHVGRWLRPVTQRGLRSWQESAASHRRQTPGILCSGTCICSNLNTLLTLQPFVYTSYHNSRLQFFPFHWKVPVDTLAWHGMAWAHYAPSEAAAAIQRSACSPCPAGWRTPMMDGCRRCRLHCIALRRSIL